ncbi:TIGR03749 family integrating conjugative element protein, partial [Pseudomonas sp. UMC3103]
MKHHVFTIVASLALGFGLVPDSHAIEILRWQRLPLAVPLVVGQERVVFIDRNVRVGLPPSQGERLRVQSAGGAIYLRASETIAPTRLQLQDVESGAIVLVDIAATDAREGEQPLEPVRIVLQDAAAEASKDTAAGPSQAAQPAKRRQTPVAVVLTRYAAQNLYAPLRTVEPVAGIGR